MLIFDDIVTVQLSGISGITKLGNIASAEDVTFSTAGNVVDLELNCTVTTTLSLYAACWRS